MTQSDAWNETVARLLAAATAGDLGIVAACAALAPVAGPAGAAERRVVGEQVFVTLVNNSHHALAAEIAAAEGLRARVEAATLTDSELDALFCLSVLDMQDGFDPERGLKNFRRLQTLLPPGHHLQEPAENGEALALARLGRQLQIDWVSPGTPPEPADCPTCGAVGAKSVVLAVEARFPGRRVSSRLLRCSACTCLFFSAMGTLAYEDDADIHRAALSFYVQLGAGVWPITRTIARSGRAAGSSFIDVGCGYGFGLDFACSALGWHGRGLDPSSLARAGAAQLGLLIEPRYFTSDDARSPADVVMASEVLEHVADPRSFIVLLAQAVAPGGMLIVTTPNGDIVRPQTEPSVLMPALSVGAHTVLQTPASLERLLREAGMAHVIVDATPHTLIAFASTKAFELVSDESVLVARYRRYLEARLNVTEAGSDLWLGFAGRVFQEASLHGDFVAADGHYAAISAEVCTRFGFDLNEIADLPVLPDGLTPETLAGMAPFGLANLLYVRALQDHAQGRPAAEVWPRYAAAAAIARQIRPALRRMNADTISVASIETEGATQAALLAAGSGSPEALHWLRFIEAGQRDDPAALHALAQEVVIDLAVAGQWRAAARGWLDFRPPLGPTLIAALQRRLALAPGR